MRLKNIILLICIIILTANSNVYAEAATVDEIIQPFYITISSATADLTNKDGLLTMQSKLVAKKKSDLSITMKLQKKSGTTWTTINTWNSSKAAAYSLIISDTYTVSKGTYRISASFSAGSETTTAYSATITY